ncbi:S-adenosyl-L-methionine uroporphyrinogen methyltransferase related protein [Thermoplasma acidophilum]|uniref:uroporphyrinogen-III C-methyltransferase n=1 Tax=Thermoplasma acidophilum (strain ATCC 25905 / DSM 1728 / JCM 9062 / NBRC 15155 / AMRC-C165) TaxID=273075 RepID=Q9HKE8_THEAC|nr:uroporphyrinogen-III C-methyltransferase [Thermoplasma acidophilum]CAC11791.1 S-adenosyl-L-methionine uroporphyrinogen methyltransferase related protein [Thermoplasma acidophilum]
MKSRKYYIVGAGPGDPGLITVRAVKAIAESDLVLVDSLVPDEIIESVCAGKRVLRVGHRASGGHSGIIDRISAILDSTEFSVASHLKEGDPSVFSHLYEEIRMIMDRGIEYEVIPGVSSAIAVPEAAGIVLTGRGRSESFTVVSASDASGGFNEAEIRSALNASGSVVIMMGSRYLGRIRDLLIGIRYEWPIAIIENGTRTDQRVLVYRDAWHIGDQEIRMPAIIVVGRMIMVDGVIEKDEAGIRN